jgi:hypothetical protein
VKQIFTDLAADTDMHHLVGKRLFCHPEVWKETIDEWEVSDSQIDYIERVAAELKDIEFVDATPDKADAVPDGVRAWYRCGHYPIEGGRLVVGVHDWTTEAVFWLELEPAEGRP